MKSGYTSTLKVFIILIASSHVFLCAGQKDSGASFKLSGYIDAYYAYYTDSLKAGNYQKFAAISPRSNNFGISIAEITAQYNSNKIRSTITIHSGDLPSAAWSPVYNYIQEANAGFSLFKNFWIDAGFFKTHIGTEGLLPKDNVTSSVSVITFYEPWWQSGVRLSWTGNGDKFYGALYIVNGYNEFVATNKKKAVGLALNYAFSDNFNVGYYNFLSDNTPDYISTSLWRFLNNLVVTANFCKKWKAIIGADLISQQNSSPPYTTIEAGTAWVYSGIIALKYQWFKKFGIYGRFEEFNDPQGFLTGIYYNSQGNYTGYQLNGETLGLEYKPTGNSYIRLEGREINMMDHLEIFRTDGKYVSDREEIMMNLGIWF